MPEDFENCIIDDTGYTVPVVIWVYRGESLGYVADYSKRIIRTVTWSLFTERAVKAWMLPEPYKRENEVPNSK